MEWLRTILCGRKQQRRSSSRLYLSAGEFITFSDCDKFDNFVRPGKFPLAGAMGQNASQGNSSAHLTPARPRPVMDGGGGGGGVTIDEHDVVDGMADGRKE